MELLAAAEICLRRNGHAELSTRRVAETAGVPLSQIHYHFGSKHGCSGSARSSECAPAGAPVGDLCRADTPLWQRWERACDFLDEDLSSGYVRILQDMMAAGWSDPEIAEAVRAICAAGMLS